MIRYLPKLDSILWALKSQEAFDTLDDLRRRIADQRTAFYRAIGRETSYQPGEVELCRLSDRDPFLGWTNYCSVAVGGVVVGYCGE